MRGEREKKEKTSYTASTHPTTQPPPTDLATCQTSNMTSDALTHALSTSHRLDDPSLLPPPPPLLLSPPDVALPPPPFMTSQPSMEDVHPPPTARRRSRFVCVCPLD